MPTPVPTRCPFPDGYPRYPDRRTQVGEPAGQFSSFFYGKIEPSILPHSQIGVQIADLWWNPAEELARWGAQPIADEYYNGNGRL